MNATNIRISTSKKTLAESTRPLTGEQNKSSLGNENADDENSLGTLHKKLRFPLRISSVNVTKFLTEYFIFCAVVTKTLVMRQVARHLQLKTTQVEFI